MTDVATAMQDGTTMGSIGELIRLAIAPVFLFSGVAALLSVMTNRLARIIDRGRSVEAGLAAAPAERLPRHHEHLATLSRRAKAINAAITLCTCTSLLVCAVIITLFLGAFLHFDASTPVALLFIAAMLALFFGLLSFLREIFIATRSLRIGPERPGRT